MKNVYLFCLSLFMATVANAQLPALNCGTGTATLLYSQDFESSFPADWSNSAIFNPQWTYGTGFTSSSSTGPSGAFNNTGYLYLECSGGSQGDTDTLFAPSVNLTSTVDAARATWAYHMYGATMGTMKFQVSTDGVVWDELWSITGQVQTSEAQGWLEVEVDLTPYAGNIVQMRFIGERGSSFTGDMSLDLFQVEACISCFQPSALMASNVTTTTVDLQWTAGGTETAWIVEYGPVGFTPGTGTQVPTTNNPETLTGLIDNTDYDIYVYADCGGGDTSIPDGPVSITTAIVCPAPTNFAFTYTSNDTVALTWIPGFLETMWNVEWGPTGYTPGTGNQHSTSIVPDSTFGIPPGGIYDFYVQADCGGGLNNPWTGPLTYIAPITNDQPCNAIPVNVDGSTTTFANVNATEDVGELTSGFNTAWFTFVAPPSGHVEIRTCGNDFNNMLEVYATINCAVWGNYVLQDGATGNPFTDCIGTFDPAGLNLCGLTPGNTYYLVVGGENVTDEGTFDLTLTEIPTIFAGTAVPADVCEDNANFDLFTAITGNDTQGGTWYNPSVGPGNVFPSSLSFVGTPPGTYPFFYLDANVCDDDTIETSVTVHPIPNVGTGGIINSICNHYVVNLYNGLNGTIDVGGDWHDINAQDVPNGIVQYTGTENPGIYSYYYVIDNGGCPADSSPVNVQIIDCLDLEETSLVGDIYPNPVKDFLNIQFTVVDGTMNVQLLNMRGQIITAPVTINTSYATIEMSDLAQGVYFVKVSNDKGFQTLRVVKE